MSLYDFIALNKQQQAIVVWQGEFITFREEKEATVMLYRMQTFYLE